jgi:hypothetical protein
VCLTGYSEASLAKLGESTPSDFLYGATGEFECGAGNQGNFLVLYALFMLAILAALYAFWRGHRFALPSFLATLVVLALFLASDMTSPLTLSF